RSRALIAHSTAGQCNVVKRAPMPSVLRPNCSVAVGKIVLPGSASCTRFLSVRRFAYVAGNACRPSPSVTPSANGSFAPPAASTQAQSPVTGSLTSDHAPAFVVKWLFGYSRSCSPRPSASRSAGQSRQKSGLTHGLLAIRSPFSTRNRLIGEVMPSSQPNRPNPASTRKFNVNRERKTEDRRRRTDDGRLNRSWFKHRGHRGHGVGDLTSVHSVASVFNSVLRPPSSVLCPQSSVLRP